MPVPRAFSSTSLSSSSSVLTLGFFPLRLGLRNEAGVGYEMGMSWSRSVWRRVC